MISLQNNNSSEERARYIKGFTRKCVCPTTFEDFCSEIFAPNLPQPPSASGDAIDDMQRTFSAPPTSSSGRGDSLKDASGVMRFLETHETSTFRSRTQSALPPKSSAATSSVKNSEVKICK